jgi:hypothetical protein
MNEQDFGKRMKPWLDRSAAGVGEMQATRLKAARLRALDRVREPVRVLGLVTVGAGTADTLRYAVVPRALMWLPLLALLTVLAVKSVSEETADLGELDAALLTQELPPQAFIDQDFRSWLNKPQS